MVEAGLGLNSGLKEGRNNGYARGVIRNNVREVGSGLRERPSVRENRQV